MLLAYAQHRRRPYRGRRCRPPRAHRQNARPQLQQTREYTGGTQELLVYPRKDADLLAGLENDIERFE